MPGPTRSFRARSLQALTGLLLGLVGLAAVGLENVSSGHVHLACDHVVHHNHFYSGPHEHPDAHHDRDHDQDHDHETPAAPHDQNAPRRTATFSVAPALFQPVATSVLATPLVESASFVLRLALPLVARPAVLLIPPRAPPFSSAVPDSLD